MAGEAAAITSADHHHHDGGDVSLFHDYPPQETAFSCERSDFGKKKIADEGAGEAAATTGADHHGDGHGSPPQDPALLFPGPLVYSWSYLPKELVQLIAEKLHYHADLQRFGFVCKPLHSFVVENHKRLPYRLPMCHCLHEKLPLPILMRSCNKEDMVMEFVCLPNEKVHGDFRLPELRNKKIVGSSKGWLVTIDIHDDKFYLLNPLTGAQMQLPSFSPSLVSFTLQDEGTGDERREDEGPHVYVEKVVLSSNPKLSGRGCVAMAIVHGYQSLSFCQLGDDGWTSIKDPPIAVQDVIYYKEKFYVVGLDGLVAAIADIGPNAKVKMVAEGPYSQVLCVPYPSRMYLVESSNGKLLLVVRMVYDGDNIEDGEVDHESYSYKTTGFDVFRLECEDLYNQPAQFFDTQRPDTNEWCLAPQYINYNWVRLEKLRRGHAFSRQELFHGCPFTLASRGQSKLYIFHRGLFVPQSSTRYSGSRHI